MQFDPQRFSRPQIWPNSGTCASQHFLFFDNRRKIKSRKPRFVSRPPLSRLRRRFAPLRGTQRRCAALRATPPGRYAPRALRAQPFCKHEKNAYFTGVCPSERNELQETASRSRAAFSCNEPTGRLVELIKTRRTHYGTFSEASPAGFYSRSPAAHHWSPRRCGVPPNLTESSSQGRVQTTPSVNKWSAASRRSALV